MGSRVQLTQFTDESALMRPNVQEGIESLLPEQAIIEAAYIHVPFCRHRCHYCDFFTIAGRDDAMEAFVERMEAEIQSLARRLTSPLASIFIGGGTPTMLPPALFARVLEAVRSHLPMRMNCEWTVEANPETVTPLLAEVMVSGGVNRVSLGAQSFDQARLDTLERRHDPESVFRSLEILRAAGINRLSLDLIFAIPGQDLAGWDADLQTALELQLEHLSCYGLVYESGTPLTRRRNNGNVIPVDNEVEADMYSHTMTCLAEHGYQHYEISNWAQPGAACRHNMLYWANGNWWPIGPGASGHVEGVRWKNLPRLGRYLEAPNGPQPEVVDVERLDQDDHIGERLMLGLRVIAGLPRSDVNELLSNGLRASDRRAAIERHLASGHLQWNSDRLCLTKQGIMIADSVFVDLL